VSAGEDVRMRFELEAREVPAERVAVVRERTHMERLSEVIPRQIEEVGSYLKEIGASPAGPPFCVCPMHDDTGMTEVETGWPVADDVTGSAAVEVKTYPSRRALVLKHTGPYAELGRSYRLMGEVMEEHGLEPVGDPREIYWSDPAEVPDPNDYVTEIVWPIGPEGELDPSRDVFTRPADA
jgi:effector-binding domain-containing protein